MEYIRQGGTLPVPFNIIPTPKSFYNLIKRLTYCFSKKKQPPKQELEMPSIRQGKRMQNPVSNGLQKTPRRQSNAEDDLTYIVRVFRKQNISFFSLNILFSFNF
jgi:hypothetical protein